MESEDLGSDPGTVSYYLDDFGEVTSLLSFPICKIEHDL